jgi:hypothetical protein
VAIVRLAHILESFLATKAPVTAQQITFTFDGRLWQAQVYQRTLFQDGVTTNKFELHVPTDHFMFSPESDECTPTNKPGRHPPYTWSDVDLRSADATKFDAIIDHAETCFKHYWPGITDIELQVFYSFLDRRIDIILTSQDDTCELEISFEPGLPVCKAGVPFTRTSLQELRALRALATTVATATTTSSSSSSSH